MPPPRKRNHCIHNHCRHMEGINFERLTKKVMRSGAWEAFVPTITHPSLTIRQDSVIQRCYIYEEVNGT